MNNILRDKFFSRVTEDFKVMSTLVMKQVTLVKGLFLSTEKVDLETIHQELYTNERILDSLDVKLRREIINAIVLYSPRATDLRQIMSNYDMTGYLERVGDLVLNISRHLLAMNVKGEICRKYAPDLTKLLTTSANMIEQSILAFNNENNALAHAIIEGDDVVDNLYHSIQTRTRSDYGGKQLSESELNDILGINGIAYNVERIADNATNIAEAAIYFAAGEDVKHSKLKKEEQEMEEQSKK